MLATLFEKYNRCTACDDRHVNMKGFLDVAVWCLNQLQPAFMHPRHDHVEALGERVYMAMGTDVYAASTIGYDKLAKLAIAQWNHGTTLLRTNPGQDPIVPPVVWQQHPWGAWPQYATPHQAPTLSGRIE